jgi:hypothetical protein
MARQDDGLARLHALQIARKVRFGLGYVYLDHDCILDHKYSHVNGLLFVGRRRHLPLVERVRPDTALVDLLHLSVTPSAVYEGVGKEAARVSLGTEAVLDKTI